MFVAQNRRRIEEKAESNLARAGKHQISSSMPTIDRGRFFLKKNSKLIVLPSYSRHFSETYLRCKKFIENLKAKHRSTNAVADFQGRKVFPRQFEKGNSLDSLEKGFERTLDMDSEKELLPFLSETDLPIRMPSSIVMLPPLYSQHETQLQSRNFRRDSEFLKKISGDEIDWEDIKYCRYLRIPRNRNVKTNQSRKNHKPHKKKN